MIFSRGLRNFTTSFNVQPLTAAMPSAFSTDDGGQSWTPLEGNIGTRDMAVGPQDWLLAGGTDSAVWQKRGAAAKWEKLDVGKAAQTGKFYNAAYVAITDAQTALVVLNEPPTCTSR